MLKTMRFFSRKISFFMIAAFILNIYMPLYSQTLWERAKATFSRGKETGMQALGKVKDVATNVSSKLNESLKGKLEQLKNAGPAIVVPSLLSEIEKLKQHIGTVAPCMIAGTCTNEAKAAFIAVAMKVLALTVALGGLTAATITTISKKVDEQVVKISEEVKGWTPQAIFTRLKNTVNAYGQTILNLKPCLLNRQCTADQKKALSIVAITIVVLVTVAVAVGIGSYVYSQQQQKEGFKAPVTAPEIIEGLGVEAREALQQVERPLPQPAGIPAPLETTTTLEEIMKLPPAPLDERGLPSLEDLKARVSVPGSQQEFTPPPAPPLPPQLPPRIPSAPRVAPRQPVPAPSQTKEVTVEDIQKRAREIQERRTAQPSSIPLAQPLAMPPGVSPAPKKTAVGGEREAINPAEFTGEWEVGEYEPTAADIAEEQARQRELKALEEERILAERERKLMQQKTPVIIDGVAPAGLEQQQAELKRQQEARKEQTESLLKALGRRRRVLSEE